MWDNMHIVFYSIYEVLIKAIPETLLSVYGVFLLSKTKISFKKYLGLCLIHFSSIYLLRSICISTGAVTLFNLLITVIAFKILCNTEIFKTLISAFIMIIIVLVSELIGFMLLGWLYDTERIQILLMDPFGRSICGIPSTVIFGSIVLLIKLLMNYTFKNNIKAKG